MSESKPVVLDFTIDRTETDHFKNTKTITLPVTIHSQAHNKRLQFLVNHNYSFDAADKFSEAQTESNKDT